MDNKLNIFLLSVPISFGVFYFFDNPVIIFITSAIAIIPLAIKMNYLIDKIAGFLGSGWGGLLSITFGNTTELIISLFAILDGLLSVVKAEITGSIIMNLLLVLGLSFFIGGLKRRKQTFDRVMAITNSAMLMLAVTGMLIPAIFYFGSSNIKTVVLGRLSIGVGIVLFLTYIAGLYFILFIHEKEKNNNQESENTAEENPENKQIYKYVIYLLINTVFIALVANILVGSIKELTDTFGISPVFIGVIILPVIANVAENFTAINMARLDNINLSINIAVGSSIQVALFLVPLLIFISHIIGQPMNVLFNILEISSIAMSVLVINIVYLQGKSNWFEGLQLCATYLIIAIAFFYA